MQRFVALAVVLLLTGVARSTGVASADELLKLMLVTGGCCHDYRFQTEAMQQAVKEAGVSAQWTVVNDGGTGTDAEIKLYQDPKWADGFDVVIHNECFADTKDPEYIRRITAPHHAGINAVVIHCAMHTYRGAEINDWREFLGVTSRRHDHQSKYKIEVVAPDHPIMKNFPVDHVSAMDELYIIEKLWPTATALATSPSERNGEKHPVFWVNQYGDARVFGTTYGHSSDTFADPVYLKTLTRGILWSAGRLDE